MARCDEEVPFIEKEDSSESIYQSPSKCSHLSRHSQRRVQILLFALLVLNLILLGINLQHFRSSSPEISHLHSADDYSPASSAISYKTTKVDFNHPDSRYLGTPRPEFNDAWDKLLNFTVIEVTADELRAANKTSMQLAEGDNFMAGPAVYHQLHCLKRIIQTRYPEHYPELVMSNSLTEGHFDHCIDVLRQALMCRADMHLVTFVWNDELELHYSANANGPQTCVDWDRIEEWARPRWPRTMNIAVGEGRGITGP